MDKRQLFSVCAIVALLLLLSMLPVRVSAQFYGDDGDDDGLLDTFSLSFVGNFNFAKAIEGVTKIVDGVSNFIDMPMIGAAVDMIVERFLPLPLQSNEVNDSPINRIDVVAPDHEGGQAFYPSRKMLLKQEMTTLLGAALNKQQCFERAACVLGRRASTFAAKDVVFILIEKLLPAWKTTLDLVRGGAGAKGVAPIDCSSYMCSAKRVA